MELTTKSATPSRQKITPIALKLALILILLVFKTDEPYTELIKPIMSCLCSYSSTSSSHSLSCSLLKPSSLNEYFHFLTGSMTKFFNGTLPRIVASGITMYLGVCCVYVGSVHLKWLNTNAQHGIRRSVGSWFYKSMVVLSWRILRLYYERKKVKK